MLRSRREELRERHRRHRPRQLRRGPRRDARQRRRDHARDPHAPARPRSSARRARTTRRSGCTSRATGRRSFPAEVRFRLEKVQDLRYGENPHQERGVLPLHRRARSTRSPAPSSCRARSSRYNNILDTDACWTAVREFAEPACVIVKHTNPCGTCDRRRHRRPPTSKAHDADPISRVRRRHGVQPHRPARASSRPSTRTSSSSRS